MISNVSHNDKETREQIESLVGPPLPMISRIKMRGNGSPRFRIIESSEAIREKISRTNMINYCNIELRPAGIVVGFRSHQENYAWSIPYYKLSIHSTGKRYTIYHDTEYIKIENDHKSGVNAAFLKKLRSMQSKSLGDSFIDY